MHLPFPNSGGNERINKMATGINHPAFRLRRRVTTGVSQSMICHKYRVMMLKIVDRLTHRCMEKCHQGDQNDHNDEDHIIPYPFLSDPKPPVFTFCPCQNTPFVLYPFLFRELVLIKSVAQGLLR